MDKYIKDLQEELASKMATNDLPYDYRMRCINEYTENIVKLFAIPDVSGLACNCIGMTEVHQINDKFLCGTYGKPLRQACR